MKRVCFGYKSQLWMKALVFNISISILINGMPTSEFLVKRGVRKGEPLPSFIFLVAFYDYTIPSMLNKS